MAKKKRKKSTRKSNTVYSNREKFAVFFLTFMAISLIAILFKDRTAFLGKYLGGFYFGLFGAGAYAFPILATIVYFIVYAGYFKGQAKRNFIYIILLFFTALIFYGSIALNSRELSGMLAESNDLAAGNVGPGWIGTLGYFGLSRIIGKLGVWILSAVILFLTVLSFLKLTFMDFLRMTFQGASNKWTDVRAKKMRRREKRREERKDIDTGEDATLEFSEIPEDSEEDREIQIVGYQQPLSYEDFVDEAEEEPVKEEAEQQRMEELEEMEEESSMEYHFPPLELLKDPPRGNEVDQNRLKHDARVIEDTLRSFQIDSQVTSIRRGPSVTCYELKPQAGIKVSRIVNLSDDLALALASSGIRIEAPIPGKSLVGIEVPNSDKDIVTLKEIITSEEFRETDAKLPIALGKGISGNCVVADIASMPHALIAGATGSGKSVCINTIIMSILYKHSPDEVRLLLVDPKVVELSVYDGIPHLIMPVVTDPKKASKALAQAVLEMEKRFKIFSENSCRDIGSYKEKAKREGLPNMPYWVIIIDELSDLMMVAASDVENYITRLAQMARACGIHLIIATQRPSVDVITGTIKANIPSRISFQVSSQIDSRTILDSSGAEKLLGKGDMLFQPAGKKPTRVQGAFVSEREVTNIVSYIKGKHEVDYDEEMMEEVESSDSDLLPDDQELDEIFDQVLEYIEPEETTSISGLQRRFRIGYQRAGRIIDQLEMLGYVTPQDGSKPRQVIHSAFEREEETNEFGE